MSDAYSDWCDLKYEQEYAQKKRELDENRSRIDELVDECVEARKTANMCFVKCCSTCCHCCNGKCYKLGYTYVNKFGTCKFWTPSNAVLNCEDGLLEMMLPIAKRERGRC